MPRKYVRRKITRDLIVKEVTKIRSRNNRNWMELLKLALRAKPKQARAIMQKIIKNDSDVIKWTNRI